VAIVIHMIDDECFYGILLIPWLPRVTHFLEFRPLELTGYSL